MSSNWHLLKIFTSSKKGGKGLSEIRPLWSDAQIKIVEGCNSRCVTCDIWKTEHREEMAVEDYRNVVGELKKYGLKSVCLTGGEPLLHSKFEEICQVTKEEGLRLVMQTNGLILASRIDKIAGYFDRINVSIDGWGKTNDDIRGINGYFDIAKKTIESIRNKYPNIEMAVSTTITNTNFDEIPKLLNWCEEWGVKWNSNLLCNTLYFFKNSKIDHLLVNRTKKEVAEWKDKLGKFVNRRERDYVARYLNNTAEKLPCILGLTNVFVDYEGNLFSGCWAMKPIGNLLKSKAEQIVESNEFRKRIDNMYKLKCPGCTCGYDQNLEVNHFLEVLVEKINRKLKWKNTT